MSALTLNEQDAPAFRMNKAEVTSQPEAKKPTLIEFQDKEDLEGEEVPF